MIRLVRTIISEVKEGVIKRFSGSGFVGETFTNREFLQQFGFTSRPPSGSEGLVLQVGNQLFLIASDNRDLRPEVAEGEVCVHVNKTNYIHIKQDGNIEIISDKKVKVTAKGGIELDGGGLTLNGVVTGDCICQFTGTPHSDFSSSVKAKK